MTNLAFCISMLVKFEFGPGGPDLVIEVGPLGWGLCFSGVCGVGLEPSKVKSARSLCMYSYHVFRKRDQKGHLMKRIDLVSHENQ